VQNLAITVDKVKHALNSATAEPATAHSPLIRLTETEVFNFYWGGDTSLRGQLVKNEYPNLKISKILQQPCSDLLQAKRLLLQVRDLLRGKETWGSQGVADILHLHVFTHTHFRPILYNSFISQPIEVRFCDLYKTPPPDKSFNDTFKQGSKTYSSSYIEGALTGWFKQTVENPAASLSAEKRGTLTLSCISQNLAEPYSLEMRKHLLKHLRDRPSACWPSKVDGHKVPWSSFTNPTRVHGTPMFDAAHYNCSQLLQECLACIDSSVEESFEVLLNHQRLVEEKSQSPQGVL
jgi:hypothetical protein